MECCCVTYLPGVASQRTGAVDQLAVSSLPRASTPVMSLTQARPSPALGVLLAVCRAVFNQPTLRSGKAETLSTLKAERVVEGTPGAPWEQRLSSQALQVSRNMATWGGGRDGGDLVLSGSENAFS